MIILYRIILEILHEVINFLTRKRNSIGRHGDSEKRTAPSRKASQAEDHLFKKANELARMTNSKLYIVVQYDDKYHTYKSTEESNWPPPEGETVSTPTYCGQTITEDNRGHLNTNATDVLQISTVLNHGKLRGCEKPTNLIYVKSASGFSKRRNVMEIAPLLADVS